MPSDSIIRRSVMHLLQCFDVLVHWAQPAPVIRTASLIEFKKFSKLDKVQIVLLGINQ